MKNIIFKCIVSILLVLSVQGILTRTYAAENPSELIAESALLFDIEHGQILFKKASDQEFHVSTASKLMTVLLCLEKIKPGQKIPASKEAVKTDGAILNLEAGEKYDAESLLAAIMLTPANDAAKALAEFVGEGDTKKFISFMNERAKALNMTHTVFRNATGLYDPNQHTSSMDMYILLKYALNNPDFKRLFTLKGLPFNGKFFVNSNKLIWQYEGTQGGKLGFNNKDRQSAVTLVTRNNRSLVSIILYSEYNTIWSDSITLLDYGFNNFMRGTIVKMGEKIRTVEAGTTSINLISKEDVFYTYPFDENNIQKIDFAIPDKINPPVAKDTVLGSVIYTLKDEAIITIPLFSDKEVLLPPSVVSYIKNKFKESKEMAYFIILLILIEIILVANKIIHAIRLRMKSNPTDT